MNQTVYDAIRARNLGLLWSCLDSDRDVTSVDLDNPGEVSGGHVDNCPRTNLRLHHSASSDSLTTCAACRKQCGDHSKSDAFRMSNLCEDFIDGTCYSNRTPSTADSVATDNSTSHDVTNRSCGDDVNNNTDKTNIDDVINETDAVNISDVTTAPSLILNGFELNCEALIYAVQENFPEGVRLLLLRCGRTEAYGERIESAFRLSLELDRHAVVRVFLEYAMKDMESVNVVRNAANQLLPPMDAFRYVIKNNMMELLPRMIAAENYLDVGDDDVCVEKGCGLLASVAGISQPDATDALARRGMVVDRPDARGSTPLMVAAFAASLECCRVLLRHGADPNHCGPMSPLATPLRAAYASSLYRSGEPCRFNETLEQLLRAGLNVSRQRAWIVKLDAGPGGRATGSRQLLMDLCRHPQPLALACLSQIRQQLSLVTRGTSIVESVAGLPLPERLRRCLTLDID